MINLHDHCLRLAKHCWEKSTGYYNYKVSIHQMNRTYLSFTPEDIASEMIIDILENKWKCSQRFNEQWPDWKTQDYSYKQMKIWLIKQFRETFRKLMRQEYAEPVSSDGSHKFISRYQSLEVTILHLDEEQDMNMNPSSVVELQQELNAVANICKNELEADLIRWRLGIVRIPVLMKKYSMTDNALHLRYRKLVQRIRETVGPNV